MSYRDNGRVRSLRFPSRPRNGVVSRQPEQDAAGQGWSPHPEAKASGKHKKIKHINSINYLMFTIQYTE